jgi:hypothetical protein
VAGEVDIEVDREGSALVVCHLAPSGTGSA